MSPGGSKETLMLLSSEAGDGNQNVFSSVWARKELYSIS